MEETWTEIEFDSEPFDPEKIGPFVVPVTPVSEAGWYRLGPDGLERIGD